MENINGRTRDVNAFSTMSFIKPYQNVLINLFAKIMHFFHLTFIYFLFIFVIYNTRISVVKIELATVVTTGDKKNFCKILTRKMIFIKFWVEGML